MTDESSTTLTPRPGSILISKIKTNRFNTRDLKADAAKIEDIRKSIVHLGRLINPITVRQMPDGTYDLLAGKCRLEAVRSLGINDQTTIQADVWNCSDDIAEQITLSENLDRSDLSNTELAKAIVMRLRTKSIQEVASQINKTPGEVIRIKKIRLIDSCWKDQINNLPLSVAVRIAALPSHTQQKLYENNENPTLKQVDLFVARVSSGTLVTALFDCHDESLTPSCETCPKRSGNAPGLFDEAVVSSPLNDKDICLDVRCFNEKTSQAQSRAARAAEEEAKRLGVPVRNVKQHQGIYIDKKRYVSIGYMKEHPKTTQLIVSREYDGTAVSAIAVKREPKEASEVASVQPSPADQLKARELTWFERLSVLVVTAIRGALGDDKQMKLPQKGDVIEYMLAFGAVSARCNCDDEPNPWKQFNAGIGSEELVIGWHETRQIMISRLNFRTGSDALELMQDEGQRAAMTAGLVLHDLYEAAAKECPPTKALIEAKVELDKLISSFIKKLK